MNDERTGDEQLSAWLDGELDEAQARQVEDWLREHPAAARRVRDWSGDRDALREHYDPMLVEPVPPVLQRLVRGGAAGSGWSGWRLAAAAAGLLIGGGLIGGAAVWHWQAAGAPEALAEATGWPQRAAVAHAVYAPEQRHPVEVSVIEGDVEAQRAQEAHLVRWLGKRLGLPVRLFDLRAQGFELVGGRLLPEAGTPGAQLMYQDGSGQRVTLYLRRPEAGTAAAFRFQRDGELGLFYWVEDGLGYALVGPLARERLLALAEAVYRQAGEPAPAAPAAPAAPTTPAASTPTVAPPAASAPTPAT